MGLKRIKRQRQLRGKEMAARLGVTEPYMSQVLAGQRDIKISMLGRITQAFDVTLAELFFDFADDVAITDHCESRRHRHICASMANESSRAAVDAYVAMVRDPLGEETICGAEN